MPDPAPASNTTILAPDAIFRGEMTISGPAKLLGVLEGSLRGKGDVLVGANARCAANLEADTITVEGVVQGDIMAREKLQLGSKANVQGDVTAAALMVAEGATFAGRVSVGPEAVAAASNLARKNGTIEAKPTLRKPVMAEGSSNDDWLSQAGVSAKPAGWMSSAEA